MDDVHVSVWLVDFLSMRAVHNAKGAGARTPFYSRSSEHSLRRTPDGKWELRETERSHSTKVQEERTKYDEEKADRAESGSKVEMPKWEDWAMDSVLKAPRWVPMPEEAASAVEVRYELFVRNVKGTLS